MTGIFLPSGFMISMVSPTENLFLCVSLARPLSSISSANMPWYQEQISNCTYRQFTTRFFYGKPDENTQIYDSNTYVREYTYLGFAEEIDERGLARLTQRNKFSVGETIEIMKPDGRNIPVTVEAIYNEEGESMESAPHAQQRIYVKLNETPEVFDILRRGE